ncbi:MAG: GNAT family N-acetyltransferase [Actinomycetota bacterium]
MSSTSASVSLPGLTRTTAATVGGHRLRVTPWQGHRHIALVGPARARRNPTRDEIGRCLESLQQRGVASAFTPALSAFEAEPFLQAGFSLHERLHLLACRLDGTTPSPGPTPRMRPGRPWDRHRVLDIDTRAFEQFWQFDKFSLRDARRATPISRFTVATEGRQVIGYAVTGKAGRRGYLQRLAVDPARTGGGVGTALVHDCFRWLEGRGVDMVMVNTQETNTRALGLYEHLGFRRQTEGLQVLRWGPTH